MKQQRFISPQGRHIIIKSTEDLFLFYYEDNIERQEVWYQNELEKGNTEITESDRETDDFYGIPKKEWHIPERNWKNHMTRKSWFNAGMLKFIEENL